MLRHVVLFTIRPTSSVAQIITYLQQLQSIPTVVDFAIYQTNGDADILLQADFNNATDLNIYLNHPIYQDTTAKVKPLRLTRTCIDFQILQSINT